MENIVFNLSLTVDCLIRSQMEAFKLFGERYKFLIESTDRSEEEKKEEIDFCNKEMQDIYRILKPFSYRVRELYPEYKELFDIYDKI